MKIALACVAAVLIAGEVHAGIVTSFEARWDAAPRTIGGNERSLQGGLRYSIQSGNYTQFRDQFRWSSVPSASAFQAAVEQAFQAWSVPDPVSGLTTAVQFVPDFSTSVVTGVGFGGLNFNGAEIDLVASDAGVGQLTGLTSVWLSRNAGDADIRSFKLRQFDHDSGGGHPHQQQQSSRVHLGCFQAFAHP